MGASQNALAVLNAASAEDKYRAACNLAEKWHLTRDIGRSNLSPPDSPARPDNPIPRASSRGSQTQTWL